MSAVNPTGQDVSLPFAEDRSNVLRANVECSAIACGWKRLEIDATGKTKCSGFKDPSTSFNVSLGPDQGVGCFVVSLAHHFLEM
jgi:hypothetical protein